MAADTAVVFLKCLKYKQPNFAIKIHNIMKNWALFYLSFIFIGNVQNIVIKREIWHSDCAVGRPIVPLLGTTFGVRLSPGLSLG